MDKITMTETTTLYSQVSKVFISAPSAGMVAGTHEGFSIVPKFVPKGDSEVIVIRQADGIITIEAGAEVGYVAVAAPSVPVEGGVANG